MKRFTPDTKPEEFITGYGQTYRLGLISDHVEMFAAVGGEIRKGNAHAGWAVVDRKAYPILCSEIIRINTEDGPISGRCGGFALPDTGRCSGH